VGVLRPVGRDVALEDDRGGLVEREPGALDVVEEVGLVEEEQAPARREGGQRRKSSSIGRQLVNIWDAGMSTQG